MPMVLIHGGGFDRRCWDRLLPYLDAPVLAVDLPGRGAHPADLSSVTIEDCARSVQSDIDSAGFDRVVLVGHSLAGCSLPALVGRLGDRVEQVIFVACTVPPSGQNCLDTLDPAIQAHIREAGAETVEAQAQAMDPVLARLVLGNDLDEEQTAWCVERLVPEAPHLTTDPVDLEPFDSAVQRRWIRTLHDLIVPPEKQSRFAANIGRCSVVDIDAGHMCMVSQPNALAELLLREDADG